MQELFFINDLLDENNEFLSFYRFKEIYTTFLQYMGILHMIPQIWKVKIKLTKKITVITCENFEYVKKNKKSCQYFYSKILLNHFEPPTKQQEKWKEELNTEF
jgi:hypothetical protein